MTNNLTDRPTAIDRDRGVMLQMADGSIAACNAAVEQILGYASEQLIGQQVGDLPWHLVGTSAHPAIAALQSGQTVQGAIDFVRPTGNRVRLKLDAQPLFRANETAPYAVVTTIAATLQTAPLELGGQYAGNLRRFIQYAPVSLAMFDREMRYVAASQRWIEVHQLESVEAIVGRSHYDVFPQMPNEWPQVYQRGLAGETLKCEEDSFVGVDGVQHWVRWEVQPWRTERDEIGGIMIFAEEISDRKQSEQQLQQTNQTLKTLIKSSPLPIVLIDPETIVQLWNPAAARLFGWSEAEVLGKALPTVPPEKQEECRQVCSQIAQGIVLSRMETYRRKQDGENVHVSLSAAPIASDGKSIDLLLLIFEDITERKQAELALRDSEAQFRNMADHAPFMVWVTDPTGYCHYLSQSWYEFSGQTPEIGLGFGWLEAVHPDDRSASRAIFLAANERQEAFRLEYRLRRSDGEYIWAIDAASPWFGADGQYKGYVGSVIDISDRKQAEIALQQREEQLRSALSAARMTAWNWNVATNQVSYSETAVDVLGLRPGRMPSSAQESFALFHPEDLAKHQAIVQDAIARRGTYRSQFRYIRPIDGAIVWLEDQGEVVCDAAGNLLSISGIVKDIRDRKTAELEREQHLANERRYAEQLQGLTTASLAINSALSVQEVLRVITDRAAAIVGSHQSITSLTIDQNWAQAITAVYLSDKYAQWREYDEPTDGSGIYACVCHLNRPIRMTQSEVEAHPQWKGFGKSADKHPPMRGWLAAPLVGRDGQNIGLIQLSDKYEGDFTAADEAVLVQLAQMASIALENARLYEAEQQAREQAQTANRIKDEFLAVLSHELRSPLNPILGWARLLQTRQFSASKTAEALATIERNAKLQSQLIEDLLDISRIMRGKLTLNSAPVSLAFVISAAIETVRLAAEAKQIQIISSLDPVDSVLGDSGRLQQIVWNLLSNAVKFTPSGGRVEVRLAGVRDWGLGVREQPSPNPQPLIPNSSIARLTVSDTGKGIHPDFLPHVFEYFRQEDGSTTRKFGGLGLGLAIARQIVEMHGGTISADSAGEGQGATFTVQLPTLKQADPLVADSIAPVPTAAEPLANLRILLVDDADDTREFLTFLLEGSGAVVKAASSAIEALQTLEQFQPDILLSDIGMPEMNGYELLQSIRSQAVGKQLPAIALTAYAAEFDRQQAIEAGFQHHVAKPIDPDVVISLVLESVRSAQLPAVH